MSPKVDRSYIYFPTEAQAQAFNAHKENLPGFITQESAFKWSNVKTKQEYNTGSATYSATVYVAGANAGNQEGQFQIAAGHETERMLVDKAYLLELVAPTLRNLEAADYPALLAYPLGRDLLHRVVSAEDPSEDMVTRYGALEHVGEALGKARASMQLYLRKGERDYILLFLLVGFVLALLRFSPDGLKMFNELGVPPGPYYSLLFWSPWLLMTFCVLAMSRRRRIRASEIMGEGARAKSASWIKNAGMLLGVQLCGLLLAAVVNTPISTAPTKWDWANGSASDVGEYIGETLLAPLLGFAVSSLRVEREMKNLWGVEGKS